MYTRENKAISPTNGKRSNQLLVPRGWYDILKNSLEEMGKMLTKLKGKKKNSFKYEKKKKLRDKKWMITSFLDSRENITTMANNSNLQQIKE